MTPYLPHTACYFWDTDFLHLKAGVQAAPAWQMGEILVQKEVQPNLIIDELR